MLPEQLIGLPNCILKINISERFPNCVESHALYAKVLQELLDYEKADLMYQKVGDQPKYIIYW